MRKRGWLAVGVGLLVACVGAEISGCGSNSDSLFDAGSDGGGFGDNDGALVNTDGSGFTGNDGGSCVNLQCLQVTCSSGGTTSLTGVVHTPRAGDPDPLYNAIVYVPNAPVASFTPGVTCDQCGASVSGSPVVITLSGTDGTFKLDNVPVTDNLPLVIQIGRWRRQVTIPHVEKCASTPIDDELTRLPRNHGEGDIPLFALPTGDSDQHECVLRKIGIDDAEFTRPGVGGRIEMYQQTAVNDPPILDGGSPAATTLWDDIDTLKKYDVVLLPCQGEESPHPDDAGIANMTDYADLGGRILGSHYTYDWMKFNSDWNGVANWHPDTIISETDTRPGVINTTFPKGAAFAAWLQATGATEDAGYIDGLLQPRQDINTVATDAGVLTWITMMQTDGVTPIEPAHFSFDTPLAAPDAQKCGRVVFNDFHVVNISGGSTGVFPAECPDRTAPLTAQERVLEFMLFDLSSCVQNDSAPTIPPR